MQTQFELKSQVSLSRFTTLRVGGPAEIFEEPASRAELLTTIDRCFARGIPFRVMGRGSNLLINDDGVAGTAIRNTRACSTLEIRGSYVHAGASVSLQRLINVCARSGLGGCEYLYSVPGNVGGAIFMNAGRGRQHACSIADYVHSIEVYHKGRILTFKRRHCEFAYRQSVFQSMKDAVILSAVLKLDKQTYAETRRKVDQRMELVHRTQDTRHPNAGTVFKSAFANLPEIKGMSCGGAAFSELTPNWIVNQASATAADIWSLIRQARAMHVSRGYGSPELEWTVW